MEADSNLLYRDLILQNNSFKNTIKSGYTELLPDNRKALYDRVSDLTGMFATNNVAFAKQGVKGALDYIAGDSPKYGYFQRKVIYNKMNLTGRATIAPDQSLGLDEIGMPIDMAWGMYKPFILRNMLQSGYGAVQAKQEIADKTDKAKEFLHAEIEKRPVLFNRAPTLWKNNLMAAWPKLREGKNLMINTLWESSTNADMDGDTEQVHLPVSDEAIQDAKKILPSQLIYSDKKRNSMLMFPKIEPVAGLYVATENLGHATGQVHKYKTEAEAWDAYYKGTLKPTDLVEIG